MPYQRRHIAQSVTHAHVALSLWSVYSSSIITPPPPTLNVYVVNPDDAAFSVDVSFCCLSSELFDGILLYLSDRFSYFCFSPLGVHTSVSLR